MLLEFLSETSKEEVTWEFLGRGWEDNIEMDLDSIL
jgi:hypothetical protein